MLNWLLEIFGVKNSKLIFKTFSTTSRAEPSRAEPSRAEPEKLGFCHLYFLLPQNPNIKFHRYSSVGGVQPSSFTKQQLLF